MRIRSFIIAYALVLAILLFADRRPDAAEAGRYSHVVDLTNGATGISPGNSQTATSMIAPGALIPGTWSAGQIPAERLVAPLVVIDLNDPPIAGGRIALDDISAWESEHGMIPPGAVVAIRSARSRANATLDSSTAPLPITTEAGAFLANARYMIGLAVENPVDMAADRRLSEEIALRGSYVLESVSNFARLPPTGSLIIVAPEKVAPPKISPKQTGRPGAVPVRILAMVR
jgi:kynurenine formamidase